MRDDTLKARRRLYLLARVLVARHYARRLTLELVAHTLASSPRQLQRAYAQFGQLTFAEDLRARRMAAAAELLIEQRSIPVADVARLVGYRQPAHFARAFRRTHGMAPALFRARSSQATAARPPVAVQASAAHVPRRAGARSPQPTTARLPQSAEARSSGD